MLSEHTRVANTREYVSWSQSVILVGAIFVAVWRCLRHRRTWRHARSNARPDVHSAGDHHRHKCYLASNRLDASRKFDPASQKAKLRKAVAR